MKITLFTAAMIAICVSALFAAGEPMAYLKLGAGARSTAMGGAYTSVAGDAEGAFYNPAGITAVKGLQLAGEDYLLTFGRNVSYLAACKPFEINRHSYSVGVSWIYYSAGSDIEARSTNSPLPERKISDSSHLVSLTLATAISERLYAGINAKLDLRLIDDVKGTGFGFDAGIMLKIMEGLNAGFCASNLSANTWWDNRNYNEPPPQAYSFGLSYSRDNLFEVDKLDAVFSFDYVLNTFGFMKVKGGVEVKVNDFFFLRGGYNGAFTGGCGAVFKPSDKFSIRLDYAFTADPITAASMNHRVGAVLDFMTAGSGDDGAAKKEEKKKGEKSEEEPW